MLMKMDEENVWHILINRYLRSYDNLLRWMILSSAEKLYFLIPRFRDLTKPHIATCVWMKWQNTFLFSHLPFYMLTLSVITGKLTSKYTGFSWSARFLYVHLPPVYSLFRVWTREDIILLFEYHKSRKIKALHGSM